MIKVEMPWSGSRELDAPDSSIALVKDEFKDSAYGWILELLTRCTQDLERKEAKEFWSGVTGREASLAIFLLARHIWEDNLCDAPQVALCTAEHVNQVDDLDWCEFSITPKEKIGSKTFEYDLVKPKDDMISIKGSLPTLGQLGQIEREKENGGDEAAFNSLLRMCCKSNEKALTLMQIQKINLVDRKRIRHQLNGDERTLIDTRFKRSCSMCPRIAYGALDFRSFF